MIGRPSFILRHKRLANETQGQCVERWSWRLEAINGISVVLIWQDLTASRRHYCRLSCVSDSQIRNVTPQPDLAPDVCYFPLNAKYCKYPSILTAVACFLSSIFDWYTQTYDTLFVAFIILSKHGVTSEQRSKRSWRRKRGRVTRTITNGRSGTKTKERRDLPQIQTCRGNGSTSRLSVAGTRSWRTVQTLFPKNEQQTFVLHFSN